MPAPKIPESARAPRTAGAVLLGSGLCFAFAELLAMGAARNYVQPSLRGTETVSVWVEPDFLLSLGSAALALALGVAARRAATAGTAIAAGSAALRLAIWLVFTVAFGLLWVDRLYLLTLLIAPTHALACLRLLGLWTRWRAELAWQRRA